MHDETGVAQQASSPVRARCCVIAACVENTFAKTEAKRHTKPRLTLSPLTVLHGSVLVCPLQLANVGTLLSVPVTTTCPELTLAGSIAVMLVLQGMFAVGLKLGVQAADMVWTYTKGCTWS